jgi:DNA-binding NarL/FixJ family response regulator
MISPQKLCSFISNHLRLRRKSPSSSGESDVHTFERARSLAHLPKENTMDDQSTRRSAADRALSVSEETGALPKPKIRVFALLRNRLLRDVLIRVLRRRNLEVVGYSTPEEITIEEVTKSGCDVLLVDFFDRQWVSPIKADIQSVGRAIKIVVIGMREEHEQFLEAIRCGVAGYLLNDASLDDTVAAIRTAASGQASCAPQLCTTLFRVVAQIQQDGHTKKPRGLTLRQQRLMRFVANGLTNKEIAEELHLSEFTVKNHMSRILKRLGAQSRSEAAEAVRACDYGPA